MDWLNLFGLAVALAMDAFAVAVVTGLTLDALTKRRIFRLSFHFGLFQALMPALGWIAGIAVHKYIAAFDHWVAFGLLVFVGGRMIYTSIRSEETERRLSADPTKGWSLVLLSIATSLDALAVGLSLALIGSKILVPVLVIGIVAAGFTILGMHLGRRIGNAWGRKVEILGGIILIGIGLKIVLEELFS
jgi:putative Mn2+ efflux pump MntP